MTGLVRKATLLSIGGLLLAGAAFAGIPAAANSSAPCIILMDFPNSTNNVGANPGVCNVGTLKVIVKDALNNPVAGSDVVVDFTSCTGWGTAVRLADTQSDPAVTTSCGGKTVLKTTDALGEVCFSIEGNTTEVTLASSTLPSTYTGLPDRNIGPTANAANLCAKVYASGQLLASGKRVIVNRYNLNASVDLIVNSGDRGYVQDAEGYYGSGPQVDFQPGTWRAFADYNCDGKNNSGDRSLMLDAEGNVAEAVYTGAYCP
jgi:hypothetical protein